MEPKLNLPAHPTNAHSWQALTTFHWLLLLLFCTGISSGYGQVKVADQKVEEVSKAFELHLNYPELTGKSDYSKINALIKNQFGNAGGIREVMIAYYNEQAAALEKGAPLPSTFKRDYEIFQPNDSLLCVVFHSFMYWSEASHGQRRDEALVIHLPSQRVLNADEIFTSRAVAQAKLPKIINQVLKADPRYADCPGLDGPGSLEPFMDNFCLTKTSVIFYFRDNVLCSHEANNPSIEIPLEQLKGLLR
ncbi:MAG: hypothetical protein ACFB10_23455 [Salibacteraceae bacterium]